MDIRAHSYKILSECYYPPDEKLIKKLSSLDGPIAASFLELTRSIPEVDGLELLRIDFARLFVGPFKLLAPPYGSLYLEEDVGMVMTDSTIDARKMYRTEGLDISLKEAPDHIAIELEFMYFLVFKETEAVSDSDSERAATYRKKQISFLKNHLGAWIPKFTDNIKMNARTPFYKSLARLTKTLIENDRKTLGGGWDEENKDPYC